MTASLAPSAPSDTARKPRRPARRWRPLAGLARLARRALRRRLQAALRYLPDLVAFCGALLFAGLAALLTGSLGGCGGGVGSEGTGSFASGTITGYGSIIVNGVHFDESAATVLDDEGQAVARSALALGMVVQISAGPISSAADGSSAAVASSVRTQRALVGPVDAVDLAGGRLRVLGQTVLVSGDTVFDERLSGGLAALAPGQWLEVYGFYNPGATGFAASRVGASGPSAGLRVSGTVAAVDARAQTFQLGSQTYSIAGLGSSPAVDALVSLKLQQPGTDAQGRWVVSGQQTEDHAPKDSAGAKLDAVVSQVLSGTRFVADGVTVDSSAAKLNGSLQVGARVQVSGTLRAGVLLATQVEASTGKLRSYELNGTPSNLDSVNRRFVLRGTTVSYARSDVVFDKGTAARLAGYTGSLKVEGMLSADRTWVEATLIRFGGD